MLAKGDKYVILSFDTESDIGSWTQNYSSIDTAMPKILDLLKQKDVKATFVWEGMAALYNPGMLKRAFAEGHECGCHTLKHESVGQPGYFIPGDRPILPEEVAGRLTKNAQIVSSVTGEKPVSFRAPRLWGDKVVIRELERQGFLTDSSYPMTSERDELFPYHPSADDIAKRGELRLLEIPVAGIYGDMLERVDDRLRAFGLETTGDIRHIGQWPILRLYGGELFASFFDPLIDKQMADKGFSVICTYQHPWEFVDMPGIIRCPEGVTYLRRTLFENCGDYALQALAEFIDAFKSRGFKFITMEKLRELWEE